MLGGILPFPYSLLLILAGFIGGAVLWQIIASHSGVWNRMQFEGDNVRQLLVKQMTFAVLGMAVLLIISWIIGGPVGGIFRLLASLAEIVFWGYLGAIVLTSMRRSRAS
jgi:hypothetical protein